VILIEGLDLAGKSTLVRGLRDELNRRGIPVRVSRNALCPENPIAPLADALRRDPDAGSLETGAIFLASHVWDARHFRRPPTGTLHIQDSCWLRTLAYHTFNNTPMIPDLLRVAIPTFPRFEAAVYLTANIGQRCRRLRMREQEQPGCNDRSDLAVVRDPISFQELETRLRALAEELTSARSIDTTALGPSEIVDTVLQTVKEIT